MKLYHYTNIESLEFILRDNTLKFNNLTNLDDPLENISNSINLNKVTYISCWTNDSTESIPMWNMYSNNLSGVRIELDSDMFEKTSSENIPIITNVDNITFNKGENTLGYSLNELDSLGMSAPTSLPSLIQVEYVSKETLNLIRNNIIICKQEISLVNGQRKKSENESINTGIYGKYKLPAWSFQKEWRFKLMLNPFTLQELTDYNQKLYRKYFNERILLKVKDFIIEKLETNENIPQNLLLPLNPSVLMNAQVVLGPRMTEGDKERVKQICTRYYPSIIVTESSLEVR